MKLFRINLLLFCTVLFSSCISEWGDRNCQGGFTLYFEYKASENSNPNSVSTFLQNVHYVDVFVFDVSGGLVYYRSQVSQAHMTRMSGGTRSTRPGIDLPIGTGIGQLTPGSDYRVVVWGNANRQRQAFNQNSIDDARIGIAPDGGTPLHFAPGVLRNDPRPANEREFWITIPNTVEDDYAVMGFSRAHVEVQVFVVGASETPTVGIDEVRDGFNFEKEKSAGRISFSDLADETRLTPEVTQREAGFVSFYAPLFWEDTDKLLQLSNSSGALVNGSDISLSDILNGNPLPGINPNRIPVPTTLADTYVANEVVQIVFEIEQDPRTGYDVVVGVWLPGWQHAPVRPW